MMHQILIFLAIWALAPIAGCVAGVAWLLTIGVIGGFGGFGPRESDFVDLRNYAPFARAMFYSVPLTYYPAYALCRYSVARTWRAAYALSGIVASISPAVLLALDDDGRLFSAIRVLDRFGAEVFEVETLVSLVALAASSTILTAAYRRLTSQERQVETLLHEKQ
jgi:hypothetical protein